MIFVSLDFRISDFDFRFRTQIEYPISDFRFFDFSNSNVVYTEALTGSSNG